MKKLLCVLMTLLIFTVVPVTAYANSSRAITVAISLSFENSTACCSVMITANYTDDVIRAVIGLYYEGEKIDSWFAYGEDCLPFTKTVDISDYGPGTYEVTVVYTINSKAEPCVSMEREYLGE